MSRAGRGAVLGQLRKQRGVVAGALLLVLLASVLGLLQPLLAGRIIDTVRARQPWTSLLLLLLAFFAVQLVVETYGRLLLETAGERLVLRLRRDAVGRLLRARIGALDAFRSGDLISRVTNDTAATKEVVSRGFVDVVVGALTAIGATVLMLYLDPVLFLLVLAVFTVAGAGAMAVLGGVQRATHDQQVAVGDLSSGLDRALTAIRTIRIARAEEREAGHLVGLAAGAYEAGIRAARHTAAAVPAVQFAATGSFLAILVVGGARVADGTIELGALISMLLYVTFLVIPLGNLIEGVTVIRRAQAAYERVADVLDTPAEDDGVLDDSTETGSVATAPTAALHRVAFDYGERPVLRDVSFTLAAGTRTALVGPSGAGKSTVLALLCRFYDPDSGAVTFRGRDARTIPRRDCRELVGLVEQAPPILYGTVRENLTFAASEATDVELWEVLRSVNLDGLVARLPGGLDSILGEHGKTLSGGERQRVALARTLLTRPALLLLDEPTANLDPANERQVVDAMARLPADCATLIVSHRPATIRAADQVIMLADGVVQAVGTHRRMLATNPAYRELIDEAVPVNAYGVGNG